jgi:hypothetical protein
MKSLAAAATAAATAADFVKNRHYNVDYVTISSHPLFSSKIVKIVIDEFLEPCLLGYTRIINAIYYLTLAGPRVLLTHN